MSKLTPDQQTYVRDKAAAGATLGDIQNGLREEHEVYLTYMEARLMLIDLAVVLDEDKEPEPEPEPEPTPQKPAAPAAQAAPEGAESDFDHQGMEGGPDGFDDDYPEEFPSAGPSSLTLTSDLITRVGAMASGKVNFSDGKVAIWYLDPQGRLGIIPPEPGYQPSAADVPEFQRQLGLEIRRLGFQ